MIVGQDISSGNNKIKFLFLQLTVCFVEGRGVGVSEEGLGQFPEEGFDKCSHVIGRGAPEGSVYRGGG